MWLFAVLLGLACAAPACRTNSPVPEDPAPSVPPDFRLVFGEGGGMTGRWTGFTIEADGTVLAWSGPVAEAVAGDSGRVTPAQVAEMWEEAQTIGFFEQEMDERGNMTAFMRLRADSVEHQLAWVPGVAALEAPKTPVEAFYRSCLRQAEAAAAGQ